MKCLVLAGGRGERLWPLSRKNCPKQFIEFSRNHSMFQDTIARNIPFCDEFIVVANYENRFLIEHQLKAFQGLSYRLVFEDIPRRTTASICLACMDLNPSDFVFVVASDHAIGADESYRDAIIRAKEYASSGHIVVMGKEEKNFDSRYGYINVAENTFREKPSVNLFEEYPDTEFLRNLGMIIFRVGDMLGEIKKYHPDMLKDIREAYMRRGRNMGNTRYSEEVLSRIEAVSIERSILEKTGKLTVVKAEFSWDELTNLDDLEKIQIKADGLSVIDNCTNASVINTSSSEAVVVNGLDDVIVVNTDDAVYVGRKGSSAEIKQIIKEQDGLRFYTEKDRRTYRQWGYYLTTDVAENYHVRHVVVTSGKTIYAHKHENRSESIMIISGDAIVTLDGVQNNVHAGDCIQITPGMLHQISNIGLKNLEFIETAYGSDLTDDRPDGRIVVDDINELNLGVQAEPLLKIKPVFKDYLWGGRNLINRYGMNCDYDVLAEAWILSAHPDGQSVVNSGRHTGMTFGNYIHTVGKEILGWKCAPLQAFPLMIKLIDANKDLSIQVHPDDDYAMVRENQYGKNEVWYVVSAEEGAGLYVGFNRDVTTDEVREAVKNGTITSLMNFFPTHPGDVFYIPSGTVHAIGAGNVIAEVQQSSTCTYRLYDFDRVDKFGNKRELHLDKALDVLDTSGYVRQDLSDAEEELICRCKYFTVRRMVIDGEATHAISDESFTAVIAISGNGTIERDGVSVGINAGEVVFVPAADGSVKMNGQFEALICRV